MPVTFVREKIIEPLHDRYQPVYYHRKLDRVPDIDQCGVHDRVKFLRYFTNFYVNYFERVL